jgi:PKD repeat protein
MPTIFGNRQPVQSRFTAVRMFVSAVIGTVLLFHSSSALSQKADFTFSSIEVRDCAPHHVTFTDASSPSPLEWEWSFPGGDPSSSTDQGPVNVTYRIPGTYSVTLTAHFLGGIVQTCVKAGVVHISDCGDASVGDLVWQDLDGDGIQDPGEPGFPGIKMQIMDLSTDRIDSSIITGDDGRYRIGNLRRGRYQVRWTPVFHGIYASPSHQGTDDARDSDGAGWTDFFDLPAGTTDSNTDFGVSCYNFGHAPPPYPSLYADNGARHVVTMRGYMNPITGMPDWEVVSPLHLGIANTRDFDGFSDESSMALYHPEMEDGIVFDPMIVIGGAPARVIATASAPGLLNAWIDFNANGDWADEGEHVFTDLPVPAGPDTLFFTVPPTASGGHTWARFRLSTQPGLSFTGRAVDGEVEDYTLVLGSPPTATISGIVWQDMDGDGVREDGEPPFQDLAMIARNLSGGMDQLAFSMTYGNYTIRGLDAGRYSVLFGPDEHGAHVSPRDQTADDTLDSEFEPDGRTVPIDVTWGMALNHLDMGLAYMDFGDAPMPYPSNLSLDGARHSVPMRAYMIRLPGTDIEMRAYARISAIHLGDTVDVEVNGPHELADPGGNDNDGIIFLNPLRAGEPFGLEVLSTGEGFLNMWMDLNRDGDWSDDGEHLINDILLEPGRRVISLSLPSTASPGETWSRFRLSTKRRLSCTGLAKDGEVEDYRVNIVSAGLMPSGDLGDAPDATNSLGTPMHAYLNGQSNGVTANFPTVFMSGSPPYGPMHRYPRDAAFLGNSVTLEDEADQGLDEDPTNNLLPMKDKADLDGGDDGVRLPLSLKNGEPASFEYTVTIKDTSKAKVLFVNVWFDWNRDGDWDDESASGKTNIPEWAVQNSKVTVSDSGVFTFKTPEFMAYDPEPGSGRPLWMRITLAEIPWNSEFTGVKEGGAGGGPADGYLYGETEDYEISFGSSGIEDRVSLIPERNALHQNFPNPFNPVTRIEFDLKQTERVTLSVFTVSGKLVAVLCERPCPAGRNSVTWDGRDNFGNPVSDGVYLYRIEAGGFRQTKKLLLMK